MVVVVLVVAVAAAGVLLLLVVVVVVVVQVINQLPNTSSRAVTEKPAAQAVTLSRMK
jgi:hypothetical protein